MGNPPPCLLPGIWYYIEERDKGRQYISFRVVPEDRRIYESYISRR